MPEVSVIVPNYNHAKFLSLRMNSILSQTFRDFEIIILDDRSTDNSREIIEQYRNHPQVSSIVLNDVNSGNAFKQWRKGIALAKGEFVWLAESDDFSDPRFLETMMKIIHSDKKIKVAFCRSQIADAHGKTSRTNDFEFEHGIVSHKDWTMEGAEFCGKIFCKHNILLNASSVIFEKKLYDEVGGVTTEHRICSDWLLWWQMISKCKVAFTAAPLNYYRIHTTNTSKNWINELAISYRYFITHWPEKVDKNEFVKFITAYAVDFHKKKMHKQAFTITFGLGFFTAMKIYLSQLFR